jgi:hypothetical protein
MQEYTTNYIDKPVSHSLSPHLTDTGSSASDRLTQATGIDMGQARLYTLHIVLVIDEQ